MKKKQILATLVMLSLMQGSAYAAFNYVVTEDTEWPYVLGQAYEGNPQGNRTLHAGDTLTIKNNAKVYLDYEKTTFYYGIPFINSYDYDQKVGGYIAGDVAITGGNIEIIGPAKQINYAIYNNEEYYSNIKLDNTNITIKDFKYGIKGENGTTSIVCNQYTKFDSVDYGIATKNNAKVNITSKEVSFNDGMGAIYASGESAVTIDNTNVEDSKVKIIDHYIGIDALENAEVNITTNDFTFKTSMPVNFKVTAINSAGTSKVNVKAANTQFYGNVAAQENGSINFLKDSNIDSQLVAIYSNKADAVSGESDDGNAKINFEINSYINSQGDEIYHADRQGVRTISAIRANRNSIITLDNAVGIYGDIIAGRGISDSDAKGGQITINSVDYILKAMYWQATVVKLI